MYKTRLALLYLLIVVVVVAGCTTPWSGDGDSLPTTAQDTQESGHTAHQTDESDCVQSEKPPEMWMLKDYADMLSYEKMTELCNAINLALLDYAHDFGVCLDDLPQAQAYVAAYLEHSPMRVTSRHFRLFSTEYTMDVPEVIQDGWDFAIAFTYEDPSIKEVVLYLGQINCYLEIDGEPGYVHCPSLPNEPSKNNRVATLEECIAIGKLAVDALEKERAAKAGSLSYLFTTWYPQISDPNAFPRFVSACYDKGLSGKNSGMFFVDSGILYMVDADGNEYSFRMTAHSEEITYNGTLIYYRYISRVN